MKRCPGTYFTIAIENMDTGRVVGAATLVAEQKFIHNAAVVSVHSLLHSIVHSGADSMGHGGTCPPSTFTSG